MTGKTRYKVGCLVMHFPNRIDAKISLPGNEKNISKKCQNAVYK
jgi:hypothetical protein